jgi:hypothetical protein
MITKNILESRTSQDISSPILSEAAEALGLQPSCINYFFPRPVWHAPKKYRIMVVSIEIWQQRNNATISRLTDEAWVPYNVCGWDRMISLALIDQHEDNLLNSQQHGASRREFDTNAMRAPYTPESTNPPKPNGPPTPYITIKRLRRLFP